MRLIDRRAQLLGEGTLLDDAALEKYRFMRDGYVQRRQSQVEA
ncbi:MAG TPA: MlaA family lipoprotein [Herbaspirillum sp.]|nr:MlaA family lipoprotein [Herbaspirillum sp.]